MSSVYPVEVQSDFLEKITRAKPIQALAEFIWNSLDADALQVEIFIEPNALGSMSQIIVCDNGTGIEYEKAPDLFKRLGGSWKNGRGPPRIKQAASFMARTGVDDSRRLRSGGLLNGKLSIKKG